MDAIAYNFNENQNLFLENGQSMTLEEYEALPEGVRVELIEGKVYQTRDMASPSMVHQELLGALFFEIESYIRSKKGDCRVFPAPFDVKLNDNSSTVVQPDLLVLCDKSKLDGKRVNGAPDWVIEIISPSSISYDYLQKLKLYASAGVREYWIVNPLDQTVVVYNLAGGNMEPHTYSFHDTVKVNIYDDFFIDFAEISERVDL